jgi:hypothetical protein
METATHGGGCSEQIVTTSALRLKELTYETFCAIQELTEFAESGWR